MPSPQVVPGKERPRVAVLMATFNGRRWIDEQVRSILDQEDVDVRIVISDDGSTDGTVEHLCAWSAEEPRIEVLPSRQGTPGVTANFLHLFTEVTPQVGEYIALSDQDDVWHEDRLARQIELMGASGADVVSSNVIGFDSRGRRWLVDKAQPQRRWDHVFEAAGPGCTYVFSPQARTALVHALSGLDHSRVGVHDWYLYALARALDLTWVIDAHPALDYRQHERNVQGANAGVKAFLNRFTRLTSGFYREQFLLTARAVAEVGANRHDQAWNEDLHKLISQLEGTDLANRCRIARRWRQIRRKPTQGFQLAMACLLGQW